MKQIKSNPLLRRWVMITMKQWTWDYKLKLPPVNSNLSILRKIQRAITDQMKIGIDNFLRGFGSTVPWEKKINGNNTLYWQHHWSLVISWKCLEFLVQCWWHRCELLHMNKIGSEYQLIPSCFVYGKNKNNNFQRTKILYKIEKERWVCFNSHE